MVMLLERDDDGEVEQRVVAKRASVALPPLHDPSLWPARMIRAEVAHVCRISQRTLLRRIAQGRFPAADDGRTWARALVQRYVKGGIREFEKRHAQRTRQSVATRE